MNKEILKISTLIIDLWKQRANTLSPGEIIFSHRKFAEQIDRVIFNPVLRSFLCDKVVLEIKFGDFYDVLNLLITYKEEEIVQKKEQIKKNNATKNGNNFLNLNEETRKKIEADIKNCEKRIANLKEQIELIKNNVFLLEKLTDEEKEQLEGTKDFYLSDLLYNSKAIEIFEDKASRFFGGFGSNSFEVLQLIKETFYLLSGKTLEKYTKNLSESYKRSKLLFSNLDEYDEIAHNQKVINSLLKGDWKNNTEVSGERDFSLSCANFFNSRDRLHIEAGCGAKDSVVINNTVFSTFLEKNDNSSWGDLAFVLLHRNFISGEEGTYNSRGETRNQNWVANSRFLRFIQEYLKLLFYEFKSKEISQILENYKDVVTLIRENDMAFIFQEEGSYECFYKERLFYYIREDISEKNEVIKFLIEKSIPPYVAAKLLQQQSLAFSDSLSNFNDYIESSNEKYPSYFGTGGIMVDASKTDNRAIHKLFFKGDETVTLEKTEDIFSREYNVIVYQPFASSLWTNNEISESFMDHFGEEEIEKFISKKREKEIVDSSFSLIKDDECTKHCVIWTEFGNWSWFSWQRR